MGVGVFVAVVDGVIVGVLVGVREGVTVDVLTGVKVGVSATVGKLNVLTTRESSWIHPPAYCPKLSCSSF